MPPRVPEQNPIDRPVRGDGAVMRPAEDRVAFALECRQRGLSFTATQAAIAERYGVNERTAARYIADVQARIGHELKLRMPHVALAGAERLSRIAETAETSGDFKSAIEATDKLLKMAGAYAPQKLEVVSRYSQEQLEEMRETLRERYIAEASVGELIRALEAKGVRVPIEAEVVQ